MQNRRKMLCHSMCSIALQWPVRCHGDVEHLKSACAGTLCDLTRAPTPGRKRFTPTRPLTSGPASPGVVPYLLANRSISRTVHALLEASDVVLAHRLVGVAPRRIEGALSPVGVMLRRNIQERGGVVAWRLQGGVVNLFLARLSGGVDGGSCGLSANATPTGDSATNAVTKAGTMMARFMIFPYLQLHSGHDGGNQPVHVGKQFFVPARRIILGHFPLN
jgi:hypothetical protein